MEHSTFDFTASSALGQAVLKAPRNQRTYPVWPMTMKRALLWAYDYSLAQFAMSEPGDRISTVLVTCNGAGQTDTHEYPPGRGLHTPQRLVRRQIVLDQAVAATLSVFVPEDKDNPIDGAEGCPLGDEFEVLGHLFLLTAEGSGRSETRWADVFARKDDGAVVVPSLRDFDVMDEVLARALNFFTRDVEFQARNACTN